MTGSVRRLACAWLALMVITTAAHAQAPAPEPAKPEPTPEINTILMNSTVFITGPSSTGQPGKTSSGTAFIVGRPSKAQPGKVRFVLVTAAHVLEKIGGDNATLLLRRKLAHGRYELVPYSIKIRNGRSPLYVRHKDVDAAAMFVTLPAFMADLRMAGTEIFANDDTLAKYEIHPGDELLALGFPLGMMSEFGFPILRSGKIASYPIVPTSIHKTMYFDFRVFPGNSGGPVYFVDRNRMYGGNAVLGETIQMLMGLVTAQVNDKETQRELQLAIVVPASFIIETLAMLPAESFDLRR